MRKGARRAVLGVAVLAAAAVAAWLVISLCAGRRPIAERILSAYQEEAGYGAVSVLYPLDETLFPPEIPAPTFRWEDAASGSDVWLVTIKFPDGGERMSFPCSEPRWTPSEDDWQVIKRRSLKTPASVAVLGVNRWRPKRILSGARITISTSADEVGAPLFYREVNLPFIDAVRDPSRIRWRFGDVSSRRQPAVVLEKLPMCGNCHSFSADGAILGMDVDYANDKGSYAIAPVTEEMALDKSRIITWSDYKREDGESTFGLLSQVSPDGRYVVSTVKDRSVFVATEDLAFSQLFFPIKGILAVYDRETRSFHALPGADNKRLVQSNPTWSPDGQYIVFARSEAYDLEAISSKDKVLLTPEECREFLDDGKEFLFDLYRIPFNDGKGGKPEPLAGASNNGMSNYFPKCSPDGKWIVFCEAKSFMLLQPDSELYIIPAEGGEARRLRCNTGRMNSWHSWSPNNRWLVFSSKAYSPYTQLFLTHIDEQGRSTPPVLLSHFTEASRAANIPEFVKASPGAIKRIRQQFLDEDYFYRAGRLALYDDAFDPAIRAYRKALQYDPNHLDARNELGAALMGAGLVEESEAELRKVIEMDPEFGEAYSNLGNALARQGKLQEAVEPARQGVRLAPEDPSAHLVLGQILVALGQADEGRSHLEQAIRLNPKYAEARKHLDLAEAAVEAGRLAEAADHYRRVLDERPDLVPALVGLALILATADEESLRNGDEAVALATKACEVTRLQDSRSLRALAAAQAETGHFQDAVFMAERALELVGKSANSDLARRVQEELGLYRQEKPLRRSGAHTSSGIR